MKFGERQVATDLNEIRRDHVARYEFAAKILPVGCHVIDFACGIGYGSNLMANQGHTVIGVDKDFEALEMAEKEWSHERAQFAHGDASALTGGSIGSFDAAVCFETIEHVEDPRPLLKSLAVSAGLLLASVPNERAMPFRRIVNGEEVTTAFHFRHYTHEEFEALLNECGWTVNKWFHQEGPESEVEEVLPQTNLGRTIIAVCERSASVPVKRPVPEHVVILGLGPSVAQYLDIAKRAGGRFIVADEVWSINALGNIFQCDYIFHMDDIRIQEQRAKAAPLSNIATLVKWMRSSEIPIITSRAHPDYPALLEFPLEEVLNNLKHDYFNSTAAYAVAYAIHIGVKKISLFGIDYTYPNAHDAEKGRACVEFWLGVAKERGIEIAISDKSTLMDALAPHQERFYGYDSCTVIPEIDKDGRISVRFEDKAQLPTAEEMEQRYNHSKHPNEIVERSKP